MGDVPFEKSILSSYMADGIRRRSRTPPFHEKELFFLAVEQWEGHGSVGAVPGRRVVRHGSDDRFVGTPRQWVARRR
jgi:hypothetical protein